MSSLYAEPIAPDLLGMLARHTDRGDVVDDFAIARELAEERMRGRAFRNVPGLTEAERAWAVRADRMVFLLGADEPAECLAWLQAHAADWTAPGTNGVAPHTARYLAEVGPKLEATIAARALNKKLTADERAARASLTK